MCNADKGDIFKECNMQLQESDAYKKLAFEEMKKNGHRIQTKLRGIIGRHGCKERITKQKKECLLSKEYVFEVPHFSIIRKILKNPPIGRPIVPVYNLIFNTSLYIRIYRSVFKRILFKIQKYSIRKFGINTLY